MTYPVLRRSACLLAFIVAGPLAVTAQGFDNGRFDTQTGGQSGGQSGGGAAPPPPPPDNGGGATPPPPPPPSNTGGGATPPPPPPPPDNGGGGGGGGGQANVPPAPDAPDPGPQIDPQIAAYEARDYGVPPQQTLRQDQFHGQTPTSIPGAQLLTTANLVKGLNAQTPMVIIDVLGSGYGLPNAYVATALASPGSFDDRTQQQASQWLNQITGGNRQMPIVIYCSDPMCWLSYNATLRTAAAGYTNVLWYRGGLAAWEMAGLPLRPTGF